MQQYLLSQQCCHPVWKWLRERGKNLWLARDLDSISIWRNTDFTTYNFGRVYAAHGGVFIFSSLIWYYWIDKKPDRFETIGSIMVLVGVIVMFYFPR